VVHVAHCYPFSYTDLQHHLATLSLAASAALPGPAHDGTGTQAAAAGGSDAAAAGATAVALTRERLALTLAGNAVEVVTLTASVGTTGAVPLDQRRGVVLSGDHTQWLWAARWRLLHAKHEKSQDGSTGPSR
jgi:hypothetical protein